MTTVRLMVPVWEYCRAEAAARGVPLGTYVADVMAVHANRADLIQELTDHRELFSIGLQSTSRPDLPVSGCSDIAPRMTTARPPRMTTARLMRPVWEYCRAKAAARRLPISIYVADVMAVHANRADLIQELTDPKELLPLAL